MKQHALTIHANQTNQALCFIQSPAFGEAILQEMDFVQRLVLNDGKNRVHVGVTGRKLSIEDIRRIARQAVDRNFDVRA